MKRNQNRKNVRLGRLFNQSAVGRAGGYCGAMIEPLEERQMMTLTVQVEGIGGTNSATVNTVGQVVSLRIYAIITDPDNTPTADAVQDVDGSFLSTGTAGSIDGNLAALRSSNFSANGSSNGTSQDLNGDGNLDVGSNDPDNATDIFFARSASESTSSTLGAQVVGNALEFLIGTLTYTVTNLNLGVATQINFRVRQVADTEGYGGVWVEDGQNVNSDDGTMQAGTAFTITDSALTPAPTAVADTATTAAGVPVNIDVLANDTSYATLVPTSVALASNPANGTAVVQSDGTITYTPNTGFIGSDTFTYTVADTNGHTSAPGTVTVNDGVQISGTGLARSLSFVNANGSLVTISLNRGTAEVGLSGTATASAPKGGKVTVTGTDIELAGISLSNTTVASVLTISSRGGAGTLALSGITGTSAVGRIVAPTANLTGAINVGGLTALQLRTITGGSVTIGAVGAATSLLSLTGAISGATLSAPTITLSLLASGLTSSTVSAKAIGTLRTPAALSADTITLTGGSGLARLSVGPISTGTSISAAGVTLVLASGAISGSTLSAGSATERVAGALSDSTITYSGAGRNVLAITGAVSGSSIQASGLLTAFSSGAMSSSSLSAGPTTAVLINGALTASALSFGTAGGVAYSLGRLAVVGAMTNSTVTAAGNILGVSAASLTGSAITAGTTGDVTVATVTASTLGSSSIGAVAVRGIFSNSSIVADSIISASLGTVTTANGGVAEGLAASAFRAIGAVIGGKAVRLGARQLTSQATASGYLTSISVTPGDFQIDFV